MSTQFYGVNGSSDVSIGLRKYLWKYANIIGNM